MVLCCWAAISWVELLIAVCLLHPPLCYHAKQVMAHLDAAAAQYQLIDVDKLMLRQALDVLARCWKDSVSCGRILRRQQPFT